MRQQEIVIKSESNTKSCVYRLTLVDNGPKEPVQYWPIADRRKEFFSRGDCRFLCLRPWRKNDEKMGLPCWEAKKPCAGKRGTKRAKFVLAHGRSRWFSD